MCAYVDKWLTSWSSLLRTSEWERMRSRLYVTCLCWWNKRRSIRRNWVVTRRTSASLSPVWRSSTNTSADCARWNRFVKALFTNSLLSVLYDALQQTRQPTVQGGTGSSRLWPLIHFSHESHNKCPSGFLLQHKAANEPIFVMYGVQYQENQF